VVRAALVEAAVEIVCGVTAGALTNGKLALSDGSFVEVAVAIWATNRLTMGRLLMIEFSLL
jgi:hypothetical protein